MKDFYKKFVTFVFCSQCVTYINIYAGVFYLACKIFISNE